MGRQFEQPLLWLDCEMTGLDPLHDRILEVACILTDGELKYMQEGPCMVLHCPKETLEEMGSWCREQHGNSGLTEACLRATLTAKDAEQRIIAFLKQNSVGAKEAVLAGNSIHMDREFLRKEMPALLEFLHYQILDVSSIKILAQSWFPTVAPPKKLYMHRALDDIKESIQELVYYRNKIFK
ncbi:oligoribonuclease, putative [Eimeria tenella]|uniref:Oligoribonuclease, putative n=1 Tax=Eimeria tenella TaxID=5802 RepID=U6KYD1_EIMTE|nr:oligoribonuclease, putative [Eimeria tenella]CDJ43192.1 oligoribonuclease, putative [Eimeria tenella]|eukprot:XP_013233942.1 oligoribonuclease, putative [Eimeria tenella]